MEYRKICNVCGQVFCYDDKDVSENKTNAALGVLSSVAAIANAVDGSMYHSYEQNKMGDRAVSKIKDFNRCPHCGSRDVRLLTDKEWQDYQDGLLGNSGNAVKSTVSINTNASVDSLIKRGMLYLEDSDWKTALAYFENALDADPTNPDAYIGKMMIDYRLKSLDELAKYDQVVADNANYIKALRFAEGEKKNEIAKINETIKGNIEFNKQLEKYNEALAIFNTGGVENYDKARKLFLKLDSFKDSAEMAENCLNEKYMAAKSLIKSSHNSADVRKGINILKELPGYKDAENLISQAEEIENVYVVAENKKAEEKKQAAVIAEKKKKKTMLIIAPIVVAVLALIIAYVTVIAPNQKYSKAVQLYESKQYEESYNLFFELKDYKDSGDYLNKSYLEIIKNRLQSASLHGTVTFGAYEQDNNLENGFEEIEWLVLAKENNRMLLISKYELDKTPWNTQEQDITYDNSYVRSWLNGDFYQYAFNEVEKSFIEKTLVKAEVNPEDPDVPQGKDVTDKVFILSISEVDKYFSGGLSRAATQTEYCHSVGENTVYDYQAIWYLRNRGHALKWFYDGHMEYLIATVGGNGKFETIVYSGYNMTSQYNTVRPCIWVNIGN